jgi:glycosyltransferase involved in cell wall biosynthesis
MEKITILLPVYNGIEFIDNAILSIKQQNFTDWKLLIGVNGHQPNSDVFNVASKYKASNIDVIDFDFKGKPKTLNTLIKMVKTEGVALIDVDDIWHPDKLSSQIDYLKYYDVIGTCAQYFGERQGQPDIPFGQIHPSIFFALNPIINSSVVLKTSLCHWDESLTMLEDYDLWLRLNSEKRTFLNIPTVLTKHRIHKESFFNTQSQLEQEECINNLRKKWRIQ